MPQRNTDSWHVVTSYTQSESIKSASETFKQLQFECEMWKLKQGT